MRNDSRAEASRPSSCTEGHIAASAGTSASAM